MSALLNLSFDAALGAALGLVPTLLTKSKAYGRLAVDVAFGVAGSVAMAWFLAPLHLQPRPESFAEPGFLTAIGSVFAIALERLLW